MYCVNCGTPKPCVKCEIECPLCGGTEFTDTPKEVKVVEEVKEKKKGKK